MGRTGCSRQRCQQKQQQDENRRGALRLRVQGGWQQGREKEAQSTLGLDHYCSVRRLRSLSCVQSGPIAEKENRICARASNHINVYLQRIYRLLLVTGF